jgi:hypothetical protein
MMHDKDDNDDNNDEYYDETALKGFGLTRPSKASCTCTSPSALHFSSA